MTSITLSRLKTFAKIRQLEILESLLFLIYTNDIHRGGASKSITLADDTKLCEAIGSLNEVNILKNNIIIIIIIILFRQHKCDITKININIEKTTVHNCEQQCHRCKK